MTYANNTCRRGGFLQLLLFSCVLNLSHPFCRCCGKVALDATQSYHSQGQQYHTPAARLVLAAPLTHRRSAVDPGEGTVAS